MPAAARSPAIAAPASPRPSTATRLSTILSPIRTTVSLWGNHDLEQQRFASRCEIRDLIVELAEQFVVRVDALRGAAEAARDRRDVELLERRPRALLARLAREHVHHRVAAVREHDDQRAHVIVRG